MYYKHNKLLLDGYVYGCSKYRHSLVVFLSCIDLLANNLLLLYERPRSELFIKR